jgi:hypothetical protein
MDTTFCDSSVVVVVLFVLAALFVGELHFII